MPRVLTTVTPVLRRRQRGAWLPSAGAAAPAWNPTARKLDFGPDPDDLIVRKSGAWLGAQVASPSTTFIPRVRLLDFGPDPEELVIRRGGQFAVIATPIVVLRSRSWFDEPCVEMPARVRTGAWLGAQVAPSATTFIPRVRLLDFGPDPEWVTVRVTGAWLGAQISQPAAIQTRCVHLVGFDGTAVTLIGYDQTQPTIVGFDTTGLALVGDSEC